MDIEPLKEKLGDEAFAQLKTYVDDLNGKLRAVRSKADSETTKARELAAAQTKLMERLGVESLEDLETLPDAKGQAEAAKQFEAKVKKLEREIADANKARDEIGSKFRSAQQKAALAEAISGHEFVDRDVVEAYINQRVTWEGDELMFKSDAGDLVGLKDGVSGLVKAKPTLLKSTGARGAGVKPGAGSGGIKNPYAKDSFNLTEQYRLESENPQQAEQFRAAAQSN